MTINEVLSNPESDESLNEWVELYNDESSSVDVKGWIIGDSKDNDTLEGGFFDGGGTIVGPFGFAIITDEATRVYNNFNVSDKAVRLYVDDASIGNGLSNGGETLYLYDESGNLVDKLEYEDTSDGKSWSLSNNSARESNPTPGFLNEGAVQEGFCDYETSFLLSKTVFDNSSDFSFRIKTSKVFGSSTNFTSRARIEDLNGKLIREYKPFTNQSISRQRTSTTYTPNLEEAKSYVLSTNSTTHCNDTNLGNNFATQIISVKGKPLAEESSIDIVNVRDLGSDDEARFGQTIRVRVNAYKGNTNRKTVSLWVEGNGDRISKQSKTNLELKYTNYTLTMPVQLKPNCDRDFDDDDYEVIASGLGDEDGESIEISGITDDMCETVVKENSRSSRTNVDFELVDFQENINVGEEFTTRVMLNNNGDKDIPVKLWSYVYRGPKSYSGPRQENIKDFVLEAHSAELADLDNVVGDAESGTYKFKVLLNKNNQKTNNEITKDVTIAGNEETYSATSLSEGTNQKPVSSSSNNWMDYGLVYESSTEKAKKLVPVFLIVLSVILNVLLIWRR